MSESKRMRVPTTKRAKAKRHPKGKQAPPSTPTTPDREGWLTNAIRLLIPHVVQACSQEGVKLATGTPAPLVSCSWPAGRSKAISQTVIQGKNQAVITISPVVGSGWAK